MAGIHHASEWSEPLLILPGHKLRVVCIVPRCLDIPSPVAQVCSNAVQLGLTAVRKTPDRLQLWYLDQKRCRKAIRRGQHDSGHPRSICRHRGGFPGSPGLFWCGINIESSNKHADNIRSHVIALESTIKCIRTHRLPKTSLHDGIDAERRRLETRERRVDLRSYNDTC